MRRLRMLASSRSFMLLTSSPAKRYSPLVGMSRQPRMCMSVDFPEPEGPIPARKSPSFTVSDTASTARTSASPSPDTLQTSTRRMISAATSAAGAAGAATAAEAAAAEASAAGEAAASATGARWNRAADRRDDHLVTDLHAAEDLGASGIGGAHRDRHGDRLAVDEQRHRASRCGCVHRTGGNGDHLNNLIDDDTD